MKLILNSHLQPLQIHDSHFFWWLLPRHRQETEHVRIDTFLEVSARVRVASPQPYPWNFKTLTGEQSPHPSWTMSCLRYDAWLNAAITETFRRKS